jgi:hypothetical protein
MPPAKVKHWLYVQLLGQAYPVDLGLTMLNFAQSAIVVRLAIGRITL